ncbi:MAG: hypothetical protein M0T86_04840, partial [Betaproteobacteria bacterium]|nr:hypothetical protein [Betaproteobacteria bacterium]
TGPRVSGFHHVQYQWHRSESLLRMVLPKDGWQVYALIGDPSCTGSAPAFECSGLAPKALGTDGDLKSIRAVFEDACHACLFLRLKTDLAICQRATAANCSKNAF